MHNATILFAQAAAAAEPITWLALLLQFGMAGAVLVLAFGFLWYLQKRDDRDAKIFERRDAALNTLAENLSNLTGVIHRLEVVIESKMP